MTASEANVHALARLANLLQKRFGQDGGRQFVVLVADVRELLPRTEDMVTQKIPILQLARAAAGHAT